MNNQSTGSVFSFAGMTFVTDCKEYSGTYIYDVYGNKVGKTDALMWYAVEFENNVYFSNQGCNNYLYKMNLQTGVTEKAADIPCKNLVRYNDFILFIDEKNGGVLAYNCRTGETFKAAEVSAESFVIVGDELFYSSKSGIGGYSLLNKHEKTLCSAAAGELSVFGTYLLFSDIKKGGALSMLDPASGQLFSVGGISTDSFAVFGNCLFASNENEGKSISKIDMQSGKILRIYGEAAFELCVCDNYLYFQNDQKEWCRMTVSGENFTKMVF